MPFVNEHIPEADIEKYEIKKWDKKFQIGHYKPSWTVDRERDIYLRFIESGREELSGQWIFCLYWKSHHLGIRLRISGGGAARYPVGALCFSRINSSLI